MSRPAIIGRTADRGCSVSKATSRRPAPKKPSPPWKFSNPWFGTVRGRAGYAFNNVLFFGTGGLAFGELRATTFGLTESHTNVGWTLGAGAEVGLAPNWSAKIEYLYVDLANSNFVITGASNGYRFGLIRAGVNWRF
ncbi:opacity protein-like surface antigen [Bradyrhizobium sp. AZCC 1614]